MTYRFLTALAALTLAAVLAHPAAAAGGMDCGFCLYENNDFKGAEKCFDLGVSDLDRENFNDKTSSIKLFKKTCPNLSISVFDRKDREAEHGTKVRRFVGNNVARLPDSLNDRISSVSMYREGNNPYDPAKLTGGCGACAYEDTGFVGRNLCLKNNENHPKIDAWLDTTCIGCTNDTNNLDNDKVSSVWVERSTCRNGKVTLYENSGFGGKALILDASVSDLKSKNFDDKASSMAFSQSGNTTSPNRTNGCGICLYEYLNFAGPEICFDRDVANLNVYGFNDKTSSVKLDKKNCPKLAVKLWDAPDFAEYDPPWDERRADQFEKVGRASPDKFRVINGDVLAVGRKINDKITSFKLFPNGLAGAPWKQTKGCGVCLFQHEDYSGPWACTTDSIRDLESTPVKRNKATSVWIDKKKCPNPEVALYKDSGLKGDKLTLSGNVGDLSDKDFNDKADSIVFSSSALSTGTTGVPSCGICLYENVGFGGASFCFTPGADGITKVLDLRHNSDKASSAKLFKETCSSLQVVLFKDKDFKGSNLTLTGDDRDLGQLKGAVSSLRLDSGSGGSQFTPIPGQTDTIPGKVKAN